MLLEGTRATQGFPWLMGWDLYWRKPDSQMPILAHMEELRKRIILSAAGVGVAFFSCWFFADRIFAFMQQLQNRLPGSARFFDWLRAALPANDSIGEYTKLFLTIIVGLGLIFEMPILVFFLALMHVITAPRMWRNLRYSILVIFIIAAMVTPSTDILNMCLFAAPMIALYGISIGLAWLVNRSQRRRADVV